MGSTEPVTFDEYVVARSPALLRFGAVLTGDVHLAAATDTSEVAGQPVDVTASTAAK